MRPALFSLEQGGQAWCKSLANRFEYKIKKKTGWGEELGYNSGELLKFTSELHHWEEKPNTHCMTIKATGEPTEDNVYVQVCL
jgi:hypothetical protein